MIVICQGTPTFTIFRGPKLSLLLSFLTFLLILYGTLKTKSWTGLFDFAAWYNALCNWVALLYLFSSAAPKPLFRNQATKS